MSTDAIPAMPTLVDGGADQLAWARRMRAEQPLWTGPNGAAHVFRHADAQAVLADPTRFSSNLGAVMPFVDPDRLGGNLVWTDPPRHRALRQLVGPAFTPKAVAALRSRITEISRDLLAAAPAGEFDVVAQLAQPLSAVVVAELLGVPAADQPFFRDCTERFLGLRAHQDASIEELGRIVAAATADLDGYLATQISHRRADPGQDLLSRLIESEVDGVRLNDKELVSFASLLLTAGIITATLLLGNVLLCLRDNPADAARLRADRSLIPAAIEETLRLRPPVPAIYRITTEDVSIAGATIPARSFVIVSVLSAQRDERRFADPDRFVLDRADGRHLGFGQGIHFCLGAPLARLEVEIALNQLLDTFADLTISGDPVFHAAEFHGPQQLPVTGSPRLE
jgi:cytochrome P450